MRTTRDILADILVRPELDELRLEYADACEAKDPSYARYIRTELEYWRPGTSIDTPEGDEQVAKRISHPFMEYCYSVQAYRGFVEEVTMDPYVFINQGHVLLDLAPIRRITFTPKPLPLGLEPPLIRTRVPSCVPELMACRHLRRVDTISFRDTNFQAWGELDRNDIESALVGEHLQTLIGLGMLSRSSSQAWSEDYTTTVWERAFARAEFRKLFWIGFPHHPGEKAQRHEDGWDDVIEVEPMTERGRAFEQRYGYLPTLHWANRWGDSFNLMTDQETVLAVQRGELPVYPVGTPVTEEMYVPPPTKRRSAGQPGDW